MDKYRYIRSIRVDIRKQYRKLRILYELRSGTADKLSSSVLAVKREDTRTECIRYLILAAQHLNSGSA